jgi:hypothetical protein
LATGSDEGGKPEMDQAQKAEIVKKALTEGIINDPQWLHKLDEPMPAWAVIELIVKLLEKLDPPYDTYD